MVVMHHSHMLVYSTYSEAGGVGKTTRAANFAGAHARAGLRPLVVPLDPQDGDLSRLFDADSDRTDSIDNVVRHMIRRPKGEFDDLIRTVEGVDSRPSRLKPRIETIGRVAGFAACLFPKYRFRSPIRRMIEPSSMYPTGRTAGSDMLSV